MEEYPYFLKDNRDQVKTQERYDQAWQKARIAANLLKERFEAKKVFVFGSLADRSRFTQWSDIDLAASGIAVDRFYAAVGMLTGVITDFNFDLVDIDNCKESILESIKKERIEI